MTDQHSPARITAASASDPEACIRDLMSLLALPTLWTGRDPATVLALLCEALEAVLPMNACFARSDIFGAERRFTVFRVAGQVAALDDPAWRPFVELCTQETGARRTVLENTPVGRLHIIRTYLDYHAGSGMLFVASRDPDFPDGNASAFLHAAANLGAAGLQSAKLMQQLEEASRAKDEFLAMLGHELRNPLAPIVTALNLIELRSKGPEKPRELQIIERQVGHLVRLVDDLLDISRVARGKVELKRSVIEVSAIVAGAVETASPLLEQRQHYLTVDVPSSGLLVHGDAERLSQVLSNLLTNAAKYTEPGGRVTVRASRDGELVRIHVQDSGAGIPPDLLPHVFDLFRQGLRTMDRSEGGLGIGLALVKTLTTMHGGTVSARSEGLGKGSEFGICLPLVQTVTSTVNVRSAMTPLFTSMQRERVLVVDDNRDAAELIGDVLSAAGHEVHIANDAVEAISETARLRPTVVVLDIGLPVMNGYDVAVRVRENLGAEAPRLIALTGYGLDHDRRQSAAAGFESHLVKPVSAEDLIAAISR